MKTLEKLKRGLPIVRAIKEKVNEIIDYLRATRIVQGPGILVSESASGVVISVSGFGQAKDDEDVYAFVTAGPGVCISGTSDTPAVSGGTNSTVPLAGATFSILLEAGTDNVEITDGENGSKVISVSGGSSGGPSEFFVPNYSALTIGGMASSTYGQAISFVVPVKAGTINFWDEGNGAKGIYVDLTGTTVHGMTNKVDYLAPADGFLRVSVYDDGSTPGECLSFTSPTGGIPLYKYSYNVSGISATVSGGTAFVSLIGGSTSSVLTIKTSGTGVSISGSSNTITLSANTGASGIGSSYSNGTITISLTGGSGSVVLVPGTGISISQNYANIYTISTTGSSGGSFSIPDWQNSAGSDTPGGTITQLAWISGSTCSGGYLKDHNTFNTPSDGFIFCFAELSGNSGYQAVHVNVNGGLFKVISLEAPTGIRVGSSIIIPVKSGKNVSISTSNLSYALVGCVFYSI